MPEDELRAIAFTALIGVNLALIFVNRTYSPSLVAALLRSNPWLLWGVGLVGAVLTVTFAWAPARSFLGLGPLHADDAVLCLAVAFALLCALQACKLLRGSGSSGPRG